MRGSATCHVGCAHHQVTGWSERSLFRLLSWVSPVWYVRYGVPEYFFVRRVLQEYDVNARDDTGGWISPKVSAHSRRVESHSRPIGAIFLIADTDANLQVGVAGSENSLPALSQRHGQLRDLLAKLAFSLG